MNDGYEITCARPGCGNVTFSGPQRGAVDAALEAHVEAFHNYMSGQEWYDRFKKELVNNYDLKAPNFTSVMAIEAARKAAGL